MGLVLPCSGGRDVQQVDRMFKAAKGLSTMRWSDAEIKLLRKEYPVTNQGKLLGLFPGRNWASISHKGRRLRLFRNKLIGTYNPDHSVIQKLSDAQAAYIAGIVDGEGTIEIQPQRDKYLRPRVHICNTYFSLIKWLGEVLGAKVYMGRYAKNARKDLYIVYIGDSGRILALLIKIEPFLIVKRKQAILVMDFIQSRLKTTGASGIVNFVPYKLEEIKIYEELRNLNKRSNAKCKIWKPA